MKVLAKNPRGAAAIKSAYSTGEQNLEVVKTARREWVGSNRVAPEEENPLKGKQSKGQRLGVYI